MRIKLKELQGMLEQNDFVHVFIPAYPEIKAKVTADSVSPIDTDGKLVNITSRHKYPVAIDFSLPFSGRLARRLGKMELLLPDGKPVTYRKKVRTTSWKDTDGFTHSNSVLVLADTADNRAALSAAKLMAKKKAEYINKNQDKFMTYGFELETQQTEGATHNDRSSLSNNEDRLRRLADIIASNPRKVDFDDVEVTSLNPDALFLAAHISSGTSFTDSLDVQRIINGIRSFVDMDLIPINDLFQLPSNMEVLTDMSVKGFEFITKGGLTSNEFKAAADFIYSMQHSIDTGCSFHIHLGSKEFKLPSDRDSQRRMISYIISDPRVPASVRERWNSRASRFFRLDVDGTQRKMAFIRKHPQGTLEFRAFGNIKNPEEAETCRQIAMDAVADAMQHKNPLPMGHSDWLETSSRALQGDTESLEALRDMSGHQQRMIDMQEEFTV